MAYVPEKKLLTLGPSPGAESFCLSTATPFVVCSLVGHNSNGARLNFLRPIICFCAGLRAWYTLRMAPTFVRQTVRAMDGYTPGEQPGVSARVVKLNTNENPFPPSPKVMAAIRDIEAESLRRYPNPTADLFRNTAARLHCVEPDMIIAGNGSDDILTIATRTFVPPGGLIAYPDPTYSLYPVLSQLQDARCVGGAVGRALFAADRGAAGNRGARDLPGQSQRADWNDDSTGEDCRTGGGIYRSGSRG